jgi:hypothetical protein
MTRKECWGSKEDHSDKCDLYDEEGFCHWYGDTWLCEKDNQMHGGQDVKTITYCTHRKINGNRINDSMNPLHMERLLRWNEVMFDGTIRLRHCDFWCEDGIQVWADGRMYDPVSNRTIMPDGTIRDGEHTELSDEMERHFNELLPRLKKRLKEHTK